MLPLIVAVVFLLLLSSPPAVTAVSSKCTVAAANTFKKCASLPTQDASIAWTFHRHNATLDIAFFGSFISPSGWVGWGINPAAAEMAGTRALIAFPDPNSGQLLLLPYVLDSADKLQKTPLLSRPLDIHLHSSSATVHGGRTATVRGGAAIEIRASVKLSHNKTKIHLVWNRGLYVQGHSPTIHPTGVNDLSSAVTVDVLSGTAPKVHNRRDFSTLKTVHGFVNAVSWGILLPVGSVTARYARHIRSLGPTWFYVHAGIQLSGIALGSIGFGIGLRLGELSPGRAPGLHLKLGIAAFSLGILQTMAVFFRPETTNRFRKYWKSYHHFVGYACTVLGVVNVLQGFDLIGEEGQSSSYYGLPAYCLCLSTLGGVCVALEVNSWVIFWRSAKEDKLSTSSSH